SGPREALTWMHDVVAASRRRLEAVARRVRETALTDLDGTSNVPLLERGIDELRYCSERDREAVASCLTLVRHEDQATRAQVGEYAARLAAELAQSADVEIAGLRSFTDSVARYGRTP